MSRWVALTVSGMAAVLAGLIRPASGHVWVTPVEAPAGVVQRYAIAVPSEKPVPTTRVEVQFPERLEVAEVEALAGWRVTTQKAREGRTVSAVWEGGTIPSGQFTEFGLLARAPDTSGILTWKVIQSYQDGSEVHWVGPPGAQFPGPTTRVGRRGGPTSAEGLAAAGIVLSLVALALAALAYRRAGKARP